MKFRIEKIEPNDEDEREQYVITKGRWIFKQYYTGYFRTDTGEPCWSDEIYEADKYHTIKYAESMLKQGVIDRIKGIKTKVVKVYEV